MNIDKYLCNLKQSYLALIINTTVNHITENAPPINKSGNSYIAFLVDVDVGDGMKVIYLNTALKWGMNLFGITELDVFLMGLPFNPLRFVYEYSDIKKSFTIGYQVMI